MIGGKLAAGTTGGALPSMATTAAPGTVGMAAPSMGATTVAPTMGGGELAGMPGMTGELAGGAGSLPATGLKGLLGEAGEALAKRYNIPSEMPESLGDWMDLAQGMGQVYEDFGSLRSLLEQPPMELEQAELPKREMPGLRGALGRSSLFKGGMF